MNFPTLAASVLAADAGYLGDEITTLTAAGIDIFHWDIMDGHFVPNLTFGPHVVAALRRSTDKIFDIHLMVENPIQWVDAYCDAGGDSFTFHIENTTDVQAMIDKIKSRNKKIGIALNPSTPFSAIPTEFLSQIDRILVMTVNPGFGGQAYIDQSEKIAEIASRFPDLDIMVDGGINLETAQIVLAAGAKTLVSGSALFNSADHHEFIKIMQGQSE